MIALSQFDRFTAISWVAHLERAHGGSSRGHTTGSARGHTTTSARGHTTNERARVHGDTPQMSAGEVHGREEVHGRCTGTHHKRASTRKECTGTHQEVHGDTPREGANARGHTTWSECTGTHHIDNTTGIVAGKFPYNGTDATHQHEYVPKRCVPEPPHPSSATMGLSVEDLVSKQNSILCSGNEPVPIDRPANELPEPKSPPSHPV